jgi:hypothetical protein
MPQHMAIARSRSRPNAAAAGRERAACLRVVQSDQPVQGQSVISSRSAALGVGAQEAAVLPQARVRAAAIGTHLAADRRM